MRTMPRVLAVVAVLGLVAGCAARSPRVADVQRDPARYHDKTIQVEGLVTTAWGVPLLPFKLYKVDDGTGELTVLSQGRRIPTRGSRVRVRGTLSELGVLGGRSLGLHLREHDLEIRRP